MTTADIRAELLARGAYLYYERGLDQHAVAAELGMSRSNVSRLLQDARERGLVQIHIQWPLGRHAEWEQRLKARFGLQEAVVLSDTDLDQRESEKRIGQLAGQYLDARLTPDAVLGVSYGRAIQQVVQGYRGRIRPGMTVVQLMGGIGSAYPQVDGPDLVSSLAAAIGCKYSYLHAPLVVSDSLVKQTLLREVSISETLSLANKASIALIGIGSVERDHASLLRAGQVSPEAIAAIRRAGVVGEICACHFDIDGRPCKTPVDGRVVGIELEALRTKHVIAIAYGETKAPSVLGALSGGYINALVSDEKCIACVFDMLRAKSGPTGGDG